MALPISNIPIVLFPLKLETRFVSDELWIRAFPDVPFLQSHDPRLTNVERKDANLFKQQSSAAQKRKAWEELVAKYGVYRAAWLVQISEADIALQETEAAEKGEMAGDEVASFYFKWLPDRLVYYLYKNGDRNPVYKYDGPKIDRKGLSVLGEEDKEEHKEEHKEEDKWVHNFEEAVNIGMGIKIKLKTNDSEFEKINIIPRLQETSRRL